MVDVGKWVDHVLDAMPAMQEHRTALEDTLSCHADVERFASSRVRNDDLLIASAILCKKSYLFAQTAMKVTGGSLNKRGSETDCILPTLVSVEGMGFACTHLTAKYYLDRISDLGQTFTELRLSHVDQFPEAFADTADHNQLWFANGRAVAFTGSLQYDRSVGDSRVTAIFDVHKPGKAPVRDMTPDRRAARAEATVDAEHAHGTSPSAAHTPAERAPDSRQPVSGRKRKTRAANAPAHDLGA